MTETNIMFFYDSDLDVCKDVYIHDNALLFKNPEELYKSKELCEKQEMDKYKCYKPGTCLPTGKKDGFKDYYGCRYACSPLPNDNRYACNNETKKCEVVTSGIQFEPVYPYDGNRWHDLYSCENGCGKKPQVSLTDIVDNNSDNIPDDISLQPDVSPKIVTDKPPTISTGLFIFIFILLLIVIIIVGIASFVRRLTTFDINVNI